MYSVTYSCTAARAQVHERTVKRRTTPRSPACPYPPSAPSASSPPAPSWLLTVRIVGSILVALCLVLVVVFVVQAAPLGVPADSSSASERAARCSALAALVSSTERSTGGRAPRWRSSGCACDHCVSPVVAAADCLHYCRQSCFSAAAARVDIDG